MELREMRAFVAAIEEGSLSAAARRLSISQPALSQTIQGLERQLGVTLMTRSSTGIQPTENGALLLAEAKAILVRHDQAVARVGVSSDDGGGVLRIGVPVELPPGMLPDVLAQLAVTHRTSRIQLKQMTTSEQIAALYADDLDAGLVRERPTGQDLAVALIVEEALGVLLSTVNAARLAGPTGISLDRLVGLDWLGFARDSSPAWYDEVAATLRGHGLTPAPVYEQSPTVELKFAAVSIGETFALAPPWWWRDMSSSVTWLPLAGRPLVRRTWVAWSARSRRRDLAVLIDRLRQYGQEEPNPADPT